MKSPNRSGQAGEVISVINIVVAITFATAILPASVEEGRPKAGVAGEEYTDRQTLFSRLSNLSRVAHFPGLCSHKLLILIWLEVFVEEGNCPVSFLKEFIFMVIQFRCANSIFDWWRQGGAIVSAKKSHSIVVVPISDKHISICFTSHQSLTDDSDDLLQRNPQSPINMG